MAAVTVAGNAATAPVVLTADKGAKPGSYTMTIKASLKFNTKPVTVDRSILVTVESSPGAGQ